MDSLLAASMMIRGYSDRINHALAFAAKHNDREVRKGTRLPYGTHAANLAVMLTRYGRDEDTVVASVLQDVVSDCLRDRYTRDMLDQRIADKFGPAALELALAVALRRTDDDGIELSQDEQRDDYLDRLHSAPDEARWICAADAIHTASTLLADLSRTIDPGAIWARYQSGRSGTIRWYRRLEERLRTEAFTAPIMDELALVVSALERHAEPQGTPTAI